MIELFYSVEMCGVCVGNAAISNICFFTITFSFQ